MAMMQINGTAVKSPSEMLITITDAATRVDRNAAGLAVIDRTGRKRRLEITWAYLTNAELNTILTNAGVSGVFFTVQYYDPETGAARTGTFYAAQQTMGMQRYSGTSAVGWEDVKLDLMER